MSILAQYNFYDDEKNERAAPANGHAPAEQAAPEQAAPEQAANTAQSVPAEVAPAEQPFPAEQATKVQSAPDTFAGPEQVCIAVEVLLRRDTEEVVLDLETTALTPWSAPREITAATRVGDWTVNRLRKKGVQIDVTPRARVLSLYVPTSNYRAAFDLDLLSDEDKANLSDALIDKTWTGHNLGFDLQWMLSINPLCRPARIIDTMLLTTACRPDAEISMQAEIANHHLGGKTIERQHRKELMQYLSERAAASARDREAGSMPLKSLSLWLLDEKMDKTYQQPTNWMIDQLTPEHYAYCMGDVEAPGIIARRLLNLPDNAPLSALLAAIDKHPGGRAYRTFEAALIPLAQMQRKGIPWSSEAAATLDAALSKEAEAAADELLKAAPALAKPIEVPVQPTKKNPDPAPKIVYPVDALLNPTTGLSIPVKEAIADAIFQETGKPVPTSDSGNVSLDAKSLAFEFPNSRIVAALGELQGKSKARSMLMKYSAAADDGRLHPLTGISTVTGRTSSQEPALQQVPRDPRFRAIFAAPAGHKIIATDFSSIELRIAAALGVRAWRELTALIDWTKGERSPAARKAARLHGNIAWLFSNEDLLPFLQATDPNTDISDTLKDVPTPGRGAGVEEYGRFIAADLAHWVYKIRRASGGKEEHLPFRAAYTHGIDPHLLTAVAMQSAGGAIDLAGKTPLDFLSSLTPDEAKELKQSMKVERQAAKAVNFGSLYGQQPLGLHRYGVVGYGLDWSVEDAEQAHAAWFDLYPEIGLWHWLLKHAHRIKMNILNPYNINETVSAKSGGKVYRWYTLSGRETVSTKLTAAANFQDQGTGAEIALDALVSLPPDVQAMMVNFVHDEFVLEVPDERIEEVQAIVERTMVASADKFLLPYGIPTEVESAIGDCWIH